MYAFYSLLVYIFYTVFKKEEEEEAALEGAYGESPEVCVAAVVDSMLIYAFLFSLCTIYANKKNRMNI